MEDKVYEVFKKLNVEYKVITHEAAFTCADLKEDEIKFDGVSCKNLFLRNKNKSKYYLVSTPVNKKVDLKSVQKTLNETNLSFGSEELLKEKLNIQSGSVSVLNIIGVEKTDVTFIVDKFLLENKYVRFHPNVNTATIIFPSQDIQKILHYYGAEFKFIEI